MIRILCHDCKIEVGYAYLEENYKVNYIYHPFNVNERPFVRCKKCYAKFQKSREDLNHTRMLEKEI